MIRSLIRVTACSFALVTCAFAADTYPRLATYSIGGKQDYYTADYQKQLATVQLAVLSYYPGWGRGAGTTMNDTVKKLKALNPNTRVFLYERPETQTIPMDPTFTDLYTKIQNEQWWLTTSGTSGSKVLSDYGGGHYIINTTAGARKDSSGKTWIQWYASWLQTNYVAPNPAIDGLYTDNVFYKPRRDGDWDLNGTTDSQNDATTQSRYRAGYAQFADLLRASSGKLQLANVADWGLSVASINEYVGKYQGGVWEHFMGRTYSVETYAGWAEAMKNYRKIMAALAAPKYMICAAEGSPTDYQFVRYAMASCAMDDGYFAYTDLSKQYQGVPWFDEYGVKLGNATSGAATSAWQSGVYRRNFENGIVLVNPKGNGARTVTLEADFVKIKGTQATSVNSGATVRTVTLQDRDGIILLRKGSAEAAPEVPANFSVN
ncbi:MAG: putative glycoside hydrolase [Gammaproteobacteria bacterium]